MRTGRWVSKKRLLVVQIAVPEALSQTSNVKAFLATSLRDAVALAGEWMNKKDAGLSLDRARKIAARAGTALETDVSQT